MLQLYVSISSFFNFNLFNLYYFRYINFDFRPNGVEFSVNRTQYSLHHQPQKGDIVTFTHDSNKRRDIPVNPFVYRIRQDVTWETVISNYKTVQQSFNGRLGNCKIFLIVF